MKIEDITKATTLVISMLSISFKSVRGLDFKLSNLLYKVFLINGIS